MKLYDPKYRNVYLVGAILVACFAFMFVSTVAVMDTIGGGKTSADVALKKAQKDCEKKKGELVRLTKNNPLNTACIVDAEKSAKRVTPESE